MKQFIVDRHTTPNTPTLEQVPTEKIPIYDDLDAVAADLANLAENQIIATYDTGSELSAPVDTVQSGNMHAVTSNAVAEAIGEKKIKFIDGTYTITDGYIRIDPQMPVDNYKTIAQIIYKSGAPRDFNLITQTVDKNNLYVYVNKFDGTTFNDVQINLLLMIVY